MFKFRGLCLALLCAMLLADLATGKGRKHCPKKERKFYQRISHCYHPLTKHHNPSDPKEYCGDYTTVLACVSKWVNKCSHRHWMKRRMNDMEHRLAQLTGMIERTC